MAWLAVSEHAKEAVRRREIAIEDVQAALESRHTTYPGTSPRGDTLVVVGRALSGRDLCVVVRKDDPSFVVTAFWRT